MALFVETPDGVEFSDVEAMEDASICSVERVLGGVNGRGFGPFMIS